MHACVFSGFQMMDVKKLYCLLYVQDKGNVLLLSVGSIQRNLHRLLCEAQLALAEEMHLHLIVENWERRNRQCAEGQLDTSDTLSHVSHTTA